MLVLVKTKEGFDKAVNLENAEFEAHKDPNDETRVNLTIKKSDNEVIEASLTEEQYQELLRRMEEMGKIFVLGA